MMFVEGGDPLDVPTESLAVTTSLAEEAAKAGKAQLSKSGICPERMCACVHARDS